MLRGMLVVALIWIGEMSKDVPVPSKKAKLKVWVKVWVKNL